MRILQSPNPTLSVTARLAICLLIIALAGCGGSQLGASASGVVTLDGKPITPGFVTFAPENPADVPAVSDLDASGRFTLMTNKAPGLAPGKYRASIQAFEPPDVPAGQRSMEPSKPLVPEKYLRVDTSGLEYTVNPGANTINIELTAK